MRLSDSDRRRVNECVCVYNLPQRDLGVARRGVRDRVPGFGGALKDGKRGVASEDCGDHQAEAELAST